MPADTRPEPRAMASRACSIDSAMRNIARKVSSSGLPPTSIIRVIPLARIGVIARIEIDLGQQGH